jgi:oligopeptide/dipeptide ABC transporter ATP-binding protein
VVETGTREDVFSTPLHPYTQALLSAALVPDPEVQRTRCPVSDQSSPRWLEERPQYSAAGIA